jgi:hypothetical protein
LEAFVRAPFWGVLAGIACSGDGGSDSDASDDPDDAADADTDIDTDTDVDTDMDTDADTDTTDTGPPSDPVTIDFAGKVVTVAGTPFGFDDSVRQTNVTGSFTYDRGGPDTNVDTMRSEFDHEGGGGPFTLSVGGRTITGSDQPVVSIELFSDTFRWVDGPQILDDSPFRAAAVDGVTDPEIKILLAVTPTIEAPVFPTDALPEQFPFTQMDLAEDAAMTFAVEDANGTLLMQLSQFQQDHAPPVE